MHTQCAAVSTVWQPMNVPLQKPVPVKTDATLGQPDVGRPFTISGSGSGSILAEAGADEPKRISRLKKTAYTEPALGQLPPRARALKLRDGSLPANTAPPFSQRVTPDAFYNPILLACYHGANACRARGAAATDTII